MNNIERHTLELVGDDPDNPDVFTDDSTGMYQIRESINDAIEEISILTGGYKKRYYLPLRASFGFYRFADRTDNIGWITDVWLTGINKRLEQTDLIRLNRFNPRWLMNSGTPESYFPIGIHYIGVWPVPASTANALEINCVAIPGRYKYDTDRIKMRHELEWAAAHYAAGEYYASRRDATQAISHHNDYLKKVGLAVQYPMAKESTPRLKSAKEPWPKVTENVE